MSNLTAKQQCFVDEYLIDLNGTQAYIRAGYQSKSPEVEASKLLRNPKVKEKIDEAMGKRQDRLKLTQDEVLQDLMDLRDMCMGKKPVKVMTIVKNAREGTAEPVEVEGVVFEPAAANRTLELLGKHMRMFTDRMDVTSNGQEIKSGVLLMPDVKEKWEDG